MMNAQHETPTEGAQNDRENPTHTATCRHCGPVAQNSDLVLVEARADDHEEAFGHTVEIESEPTNN
jgi:hypothetical protein